MSDITPIGQPGAAALGHSPRTGRPATDAAAVSRGDDQVQLSDAARLLSRIAEVPEVRQDLVDRIKTEIELGTYETPEKLDAAIDALMDDLA